MDLINNNIHQPLRIPPPPPPDQKNCCQVCRKKKSRLLRCTKCQSAYYCSKSCQRIDWKKTHRQLCGRITTTAAAANVPLSPTKDDVDDTAATHQAAQQAWKELSELLSGASLEQVQQDYHLASDKVKDLSNKKQQQPQNDQEEEAGESDESWPDETAVKTAQAPTVSDDDEEADVIVKKPSHTTITAVDPSSRQRRQMMRAAKGTISVTSHQKVEVVEANVDKKYSKQQQSAPMDDSTSVAARRRDHHYSSFWNNSPFFVEDMPQLGCYQIIVLLQRQETNSARTLFLDPDGAAVTVQVVPSGRTNKRRQQLLSISYNPPQKEGSPLLLSLPKAILADSIRVYSYPAQDEAEAIVSIRLAYKNHSDFPVFSSSEWEDVPNHLLSPSQANDLSCRHCTYRLLADEEETGTTTTTIIDRVVPLLPNGRWDDLQDYLICYPGEVDFDFSSAQQQSGQSGVLLENETMLVVHGTDLRPRGLCVLAIAGYGEEEENTKYEEIDESKDQNTPNKNLWDDTENPDATFRGSRPWRDVVGGATVTCGQCASILGYATHGDNTIRLFKQQLIFASAGDETTERVQSIAHFVAHELVRYAETKAIFTFMVHTTRSLDGNDSITKNHEGQNNNVLWLRLVSWDTIATRSSDLDPPNNDDDDNDDDDDVIQVDKGWQRIAKILFEETTDDDRKNRGGSSNHVNNNNNPWLWTSGGDWCCPPNNKSSDSQNQNIDATTSRTVYSSSSSPTASSDSKEASSSSSYVRLCLPTMSEWNELRDELRNASQVYAREIVQATIQAKMGMDAAVSDRIGLAAVSLSWS